MVVSGKEKAVAFMTLYAYLPRLSLIFEYIEDLKTYSVLTVPAN